MPPDPAVTEVQKFCFNFSSINMLLFFHQRFIIVCPCTNLLLRSYFIFLLSGWVGGLNFFYKSTMPYFLTCRFFRILTFLSFIIPHLLTNTFTALHPATELGWSLLDLSCFWPFLQTWHVDSFISGFNGWKVWRHSLYSFFVGIDCADFSVMRARAGRAMRWLKPPHQAPKRTGETTV